MTTVGRKHGGRQGGAAYLATPAIVALVKIEERELGVRDEDGSFRPFATIKRPEVHLELECDIVDSALTGISHVDRAEFLAASEPVVLRRLRTQTSASKGASDFRMGWGVEGIVNGAAELTCGSYGDRAVMTRSTRPPSLSAVSRFVTLPKTAAKKHHLECGMHRPTRQACYYAVTHPSYRSTDEWGRGHRTRICRALPRSRPRRTDRGRDLVHRGCCCAAWRLQTAIARE